MKKLSLTLIGLTLIFFGANAQKMEYKTEAEYLQKTYKKDKKELLGKYLALSDEQAEIFWPIYDSYESKRKVLGESRWVKFQQYNDSYDGIDDAIADRWLDTVFIFRQHHLSLLEDFATETQSQLGSIIAVQAYEFEAYIRAGTRKYLTERAAFVGEGFVKKK